MATKTMTGGRAKVYVDNQLIGIFDSCSWTINIGVEPVSILGSFPVQENVVTEYSQVSVTCSGFRVIGAGVHTLPKFPKVQDLLNLEGVTISVVDRQTGTNMFTAINCVPSNYSGGVNARATSRVQLTYVATIAHDESGAQSDPNAVTLP